MAMLLIHHQMRSTRAKSSSLRPAGNFVAQMQVDPTAGAAFGFSSSGQFTVRGSQRQHEYGDCLDTAPEQWQLICREGVVPPIPGARWRWNQRLSTSLRAMRTHPTSCVAGYCDHAGAVGGPRVEVPTGSDHHTHRL